MWFWLKRKSWGVCNGEVHWLSAHHILEHERTYKRGSVYHAFKEIHSIFVISILVARDLSMSQGKYIVCVCVLPAAARSR